MPGPNDFADEDPKVRRVAPDFPGPIDPLVVEHGRGASGTPYILDVGGVLHEWYHDDDLFLGKRLIDRLRGELDWFEKLVPHAPSVGTFYEDALRSIVAELVPSGFEVGTGFVFDKMRRKTSKQLDILVFDASKEAPLYRRGQFVVVAPASAVALSEVKKSIRLAELRDIIRMTLLSNTGTSRGGIKNCGTINIFSYKRQISLRGAVETIRATIVDMLGKFRFSLPGYADGAFAIYSLTLPSLYFLDEQSIVRTRLECCESGEFRIVLDVLDAAHDSGLNEFLDAMAPTRDEIATERNFRTNFIHSHVQSEIVIIEGLLVVQRVTSYELSLLLPRERDAISKYRSEGKRVMQFLVPADVDLGSIRSFDEFISTRLLNQILAPDE